MPKSKSAEIDPRSEAPVLAYTGPGSVAHVPARDLHGGDLNRIAYVRAHQAIDWDLPDAQQPPEIATARTLDALVDELEATGFYSRAVPDQPATTDEPAAPAEG